ncbi:MAG: hypothetical protein HC945_00165 [Nitrosarchaeum sp.]|nr:hypothetical protein [Nitrosarchaeum sp.]
MKNATLLLLVALLLASCDTELGHSEDHDHDGDGIQDHAASEHEEEQDHAEEAATEAHDAEAQGDLAQTGELLRDTAGASEAKEAPATSGETAADGNEQQTFDTNSCRAANGWPPITAGEKRASRTNTPQASSSGTAQSTSAASSDKHCQTSGRSREDSQTNRRADAKPSRTPTLSSHTFFLQPA